MRLLSLVCSLCFCVCLLNKTQADVIISIDLDTATPGIQNTRTIQYGQTLQAAINMVINGSTTVTVFGFGVNFNPTGLQVSSVDTNGRPAGFQQTSSVAINNISGVIRPIEGTDFAGLSNFDGSVGLINFNSIGPADGGNYTIAPDIQPIVEGILEPGFSPILPGVTPGDGGYFLNGATLTVTAVPEPASILCIAAAASLVQIHRLRKRRISTQGNHCSS